jgi:hypothetical protein
LILLKYLKICTLTIFAIIVIDANYARCEESSVDPIDVLKYTGGVISAFLIHEGPCPRCRGHRYRHDLGVR